MLKNGDNILKNEDYLFKSQVLESYFEHNLNSYNIRLTLNYSGVTSDNPIFTYHKTSLGVIKMILQGTSMVDGNLYFSNNTNDSSYKSFYFGGSLESVFRFSFDYPCRGNLIKLLNQFPNLKEFILNTSSVNYRSNFNQNISNSSFPSKLTKFYVNDSTLTGNINTIGNFENIEDLRLLDCNFTGDFTKIKFRDLKKIEFRNLSSLYGDFNELFENNLNFNYLYITSTPNFYGNSPNLNLKNLEYIYMNVINNVNFTTDITNWEFNTGLTSFQLYSRYLTGDITNWDIENTKITYFLINNSTYNQNIVGNLSNWKLPSTMNNVYLYYLGITEIPKTVNVGAIMYIYYCNNISSIINTSISGNSLSIYYCNGLTGITNTSISADRLDISYCYNLVSLDGLVLSDSLKQFYIQSGKLNFDINSIIYPNSLTNIQITNNQLYGDISEFVLPTGLTNLTFVGNKNITGNINDLQLNDVISVLNLTSTSVYGDIVDMEIPNNLNSLELGSSRVFIDLTSKEFHTNNLINLNISNISGITGTFSNFIVDNNMTYFYINGNNSIYCDLSELNISKVQRFLTYGCLNLYGDLTNWLTGNTRLTDLQIHLNPNLSGDTSNWNVNSITILNIQGTKLSGSLKHNSVQYMYANRTNISSNIETDFNFSNLANRVNLSETNIVGSLSGVTLYSNIDSFYVNDCPNLYGSNEFIDYIFENRKYFTYTSRINFNIKNIGDVVTGNTETLGDLGTYTQFSGGSVNYYWNLTEFEVNSLADGLDYDGNGSSIPWDSKQKIYWMKNAQTSSVNTTKRYKNYNIIY